MSDDPTLGGDPGYTPVRTSLPQILAEQANAAISKGADPKAVTARLGQMVAHLKAHPELDQMGMDAIGKGADPGAVTGRVWQMAQAEPGHGGGSSWGGPEDTNYSDGGTIQPSASVAMLNGIPFGLKTKAAGDALLRGAGNVVRGQPTHVGADYDTNIEALQHATQQYVGQHPVKGTLAEVAGGLIPAVATLGGSAEGQALSMGTRMARGAAIGGGTGLLYGASNAHGGPADYASEMLKEGLLGTVGGAVTEPAMHGAGMVAKALGVPKLMNKVGNAIADRLPIGGGGVRTVANSVGVAGKANQEVGDALAADRSVGSATPALPAGIPTLNIDRGGEALEGLGEAIGNSGSGPARATLHKGITERSKQMPAAVTAAFDQGTGTTASDGEQLLQRLAADEARVEAGTAAAKAGAQVKPYQATPIDAWRTVVPTPSRGIAALQAFVKARGDEARQLYGAARAATRGQPVQSPTLDTILQSPIGQAARNWAEAQMGNMDRALPTVAVPDAAAHEALLGMGVNAEKAAQFAGTIDTHVPDPEALHLMKRFLANAAQLGRPGDPDGKLAAQAQGALNQWGKIRDELPEIWRQADDAFAAKSRVIDALNTGRDVMRTQLNPSGNKALRTSLDAVEQRVAQMSPAEQQAFRTGAQSAITDHLRSGAVSQKTLLTQLADRQSGLSRKLVLATGDASTPSQFAAHLTPQAYATPAAATLTSQSQAVQHGLRILQTATSSPDPEKTLAVLRQTVASMSPADRAAFQKAAAQGIRGGWSQRDATLSQPGSFFARGTERQAQVAHAFPTPQSANTFQGVVKGWDQIAEQKDRLIGNSRTGVRKQLAESRKPAALVPTSSRSVVPQLARGAQTDAQRAEQQAVDQEIARALMSKDPAALQQALRVRALRQTTSTTAHGVVPALGGLAMPGLLQSLGITSSTP